MVSNFFGSSGDSEPEPETQNDSNNDLKKSQSFYPNFYGQNNLRKREEKPLANKNSSDLQEAEKPANNPFKYTGTGKSSLSLGNKKKKGKGKGKIIALGAMAPMLILVILIFGILALFLGGGTLLLGQIDENSQEAFDSQYAATTTARETIIEESLETGALPSGYVERLANVGMEVGYFDEDNNFIAGLRPSSENSVALASQSNETATTDNSLVIKFKDQILTAENFAKTIETDPEAFAALDEASYGRAINYYDDTANTFFTSVIKNTRNVFQNYTTTGNNEADTENFREIFAKVFQSSTTTDNSTTKCNTINEGSSCATESSVIANAVNATNIENKDEVIQYLSGVFNNTNSGNVENMASLVNSAINANETYSSMYYYLTLEEVLSKTKAGDSANAPINQVLNFFTESTTSEVADLSSDGKLTEETGSPVQSPTLSSVMSKNYNSSLSIETANYSSDRIMVAASNLLSGSSSNLTTNTSSSVSTSSSSSFIKDYSYNVATSLGSSTTDTISALVSLITPSISQSILFNNAGEKLSGIVAGEFFSKGGAALGDHMATFTMGGTTADEAAILSYNTENQNIIAMENAADRASRSPFDISSQNTFLGSVFASINNVFTANSILSSFSSLTSSSLTSILPSVSAAGDSSYQTTYGNCPALEAIGSKGDVFCNPIIVFDLDTISTALASTEFEEFLADNLEVNTDPNSVNLASSVSIPAEDSYISDMSKGNNARLSNFGVKDSAIYKDLETNTSDSSSGSLWQSLKSLVSKIGSFLGSLLNFENESYTKKSTGETYRNSSSNSEWNNYRYVQAYFTYSRVLNQMEYFSESNENKTSLSQYFPAGEESPVDSYLASLVEGLDELSDTEYLARISGMSETEAGSVLALVGYSTYLAAIDYNDYCLVGEENCNDEIFTRISIQENTTPETVVALVGKEFDFKNREEVVATA